MKIISNTKKKASYISIFFVFIFVISAFLAVYNNSRFYKEPIGKITDIKSSSSNQYATIELKNGKEKGKKINLKTHYDKSLVYDEKYHKGDFVFLNNSKSKITGIKRDYYVACAFLILLVSLVLMGGKQGSLTCVCLIGNIGLFTLLLKAYLANQNILLITIVSSIIFAFMVLLLINGFNKEFLVAFSATLLTTAVICIVASILIQTTGVEYDFLRFLPGPYERKTANQFFLSQIMIGSLGAVTDVCVTVSSAVVEIIEQTPNLKLKDLINSVRNITDDITGTMINVVLLTNLAALLPIFMISMPNDISFVTVLRYDGYFDISRAFMGILGILISIPVSILAASKIFKQRNSND